MNNKHFIVNCDHVCPEYRLHNALVTVERDRGLDMWSWSHRVFGSSKYYTTPEKAIEGMLCDHACQTITIKPDND